MTTIEKLREFDRSLDNKNEFVTEQFDLFKSDRFKLIISIAFIITFFIIILLLSATNYESPYRHVIGCIVFALFIVNTLTSKEKNEIEKITERIKKHNIDYINKRVENILSQNGIETFTKIIQVKMPCYGQIDYEFPDEQEHIDCNAETKMFEESITLMKQVEFVVDDKNKKIAFIYFSVNKNNASETFDIIKAEYGEILKYEVLDKSSSKQIAISKTSSNSGKALLGAATSQLLIGNATPGAVIGGSGGRTTETVYKTEVKGNYQFNIYLNRLDYSVITIDTKSMDVIKDLVSTLEFILNNKEA